MKTVFKFFRPLALCLLLLSLHGCGIKKPAEESSADAPNALVPSVMVEDVLYFLTEDNVSVDADIVETEYLGKITSVVPISELPKENAQANIPFEDAPYIRTQEGIALLMEGEWRLFRRTDGS